MIRTPLYLLAVLMLVACTPIQIAPTVSLEEDLLFSRDWDVAVLDLHYEYEGEGKLGVTNYASSGKDGGRIMAGMLAAELSRLENIRVVERSRVEKILSEHRLNQSGLIDSETAARIGKLVGVQAVIIGELTDYVSWNNISGYGSTISFMIRMIDTENGRVLFNSAISRVRPLMDTFSNAQLTAKEAVEAIGKKAAS